MLMCACNPMLMVQMPDCGPSEHPPDRGRAQRRTERPVGGAYPGRERHFAVGRDLRRLRRPELHRHGLPRLPLRLHDVTVTRALKVDRLFTRVSLVSAAIQPTHHLRFFCFVFFLCVAPLCPSHADLMPLPDAPSRLIPRLNLYMHSQPEHECGMDTHACVRQLRHHFRLFRTQFQSPITPYARRVL